MDDASGEHRDKLWRILLGVFVILSDMHGLRAFLDGHIALLFNLFPFLVQLGGGGLERFFFFPKYPLTYSLLSTIVKLCLILK